MGELRFVQSEEGSGPHAAKAHGLRFAVFAAYGRAANDAPRYQHPIIRCVSHYLVGVGIVPIGGPPLSIAVASAVIARIYEIHAVGEAELHLAGLESARSSRIR